MGFWLRGLTSGAKAYRGAGIAALRHRKINPPKSALYSIA
jgi:hypothetical protein